MTEHETDPGPRPGLPTLTFEKAALDSSAMTTYAVLLDGESIGTVSKVRQHYVHHLGGSRGNNVPRARTVWVARRGRATERRSYFATRGEAVVDMVEAFTDLGRGQALDIVRRKD